MNEIYIIGAGLGAGSITADAAEALSGSNAVFGAQRLLGEYKAFIKDVPVFAQYAADGILPVIKGETADGSSAGAGAASAAEDNGKADQLRRYSVLVSGDPGFYSAALKLREAFTEEGLIVKIIPGISSVSAMFAAIGLPWQDAALCSFHGRDVNAAEYVRRNRLTFFLTGKNTAELSLRLCSAGFGDIRLYVGEDLGSDKQNVFCCTASELKDKALSSLCVVVAENPAPDASVQTGIDDSCFARGDVPMTKSEVRAVLMSKLHLRPEMVCADIGCGSGSCTVEMALSAWMGMVYAIDPNPEAVALTKENLKRFHIGNTEVMLGTAPDDIKDIPPLDAAFIGGSKGHMDGIINEILGKNPDCRIVVSAIALQTLSSAMEAFKGAGINAEIVQIQSSASKQVGGLDMMMARNPIYLISGGGRL